MRTVFALILACALGASVAHADELPEFDKLWNYAKPDETRERFLALVPQAEASGNAEYHLQLLTQIARTFGLQGNFEAAHAQLDEVEKKLDETVPIAHMRYLLERGRAFNSSKHPEKAKPLFLEAYERAVKKKADAWALDAAHMMGIVEPKEKQLDWSLKALKIAETSKDKGVKGWLGALYNNIGWTYFELERYEDALETHQKGLAWRESVGQKGVPVLIARWACARMLRALGRYQEALAAQEAIRVARSEIGEEGGFVYEELGELHLALGHKEEAEPHFVKAWALLKDLDWFKAEEPERYARLKKLAGGEGESAAD